MIAKILCALFGHPMDPTDPATNVRACRRCQYKTAPPPPPPRTSYIPGDLRTCSRVLRDDMLLRDDLGAGRLPDGRMLVSVSQELWNNWCAAIGDRA